jgi:hypothetical protein
MQTDNGQVMRMHSATRGFLSSSTMRAVFSLDQEREALLSREAPDWDVKAASSLASIRYTAS